MSSLSVNSNGVWKTPQKVHVNDNGIWKEAQKVYVNNNGVWVEVFVKSSIITAGLVAYYPMDVDFKNTVTQQSATVYGVTFNGKNAVFDGSSYATDTAPISGTGDYTISYCFNTLDIYTNRYLFDFSSNGTTMATGTSVGGFRFYNPTIGSNVATYNSLPQITANTWYHAIAKRENGVTSVYLNNVFCASAPDLHSTPTPLNFGRYGGGGYYMYGQMGEYRFYNRALTLSEITTIYDFNKSKFGI